MVVSSIYSEDLKIYENMHPRFKEAFELIKKLIAEDAKDGRYEIFGDEAYAFISSYETKKECDINFEAHRKYIDIQCVMNGQEIIGTENKNEVELITDFKDGNDICFYGLNKDYDKNLLKKGEFMIIHPDELHAPCLSLNDVPANVKKIVVKILF